MTRMYDIKVGDIVSVERRTNTDKLVTVGKIWRIAGNVNASNQVGIQVGFEKFINVKLSDCWNATPTQKKQFFKAMLGG